MCKKYDYYSHSLDIQKYLEMFLFYFIMVYIVDWFCENGFLIEYHIKGESLIYEMRVKHINDSMFIKVLS
jgi:hypothetical protein